MRVFATPAHGPAHLRKYITSEHETVSRDTRQCVCGIRTPSSTAEFFFRKSFVAKSEKKLEKFSVMHRPRLSGSSGNFGDERTSGPRSLVTPVSVSASS